MAEKHYVGEINTEIRVDCGIDVSTASVKKLIIKKPNGQIIERIPTVYNRRYLRYFTTAEDFDMSGEYELQAYVVTDSWQGYGQTVSFVIYDKFS